MTRLLKKLWCEEAAQSMTEYVLLLFLISLTAVTTMGSLATKVSTAYTCTSTRLEMAGQSSSFSGSISSNRAQVNNRFPSKDGNGLNPQPPGTTTRTSPDHSLLPPLRSSR